MGTFSLSADLNLTATLGIVSFTFATSNTLPLYSALRASPTTFTGTKPKRSRSFNLFSFTSIITALALILPPVIFSSAASSPVSLFSPYSHYNSDRTSLTTQFRASQDPSSPDPHTPFAFKCLMGFFGSFTLVLGTPAILVTAPVVPVPLAMRRYVNHVIVSRVILLAVAAGIALLSAALVRLVSDVLIVLAFLGTFTIPGKSSILTIRILSFAHTVSTILIQPCYISLYITSAGLFLSLCLLQLPDLASHPVSNEASHTTMNCCSGKNVRCSIGGLPGVFCGILVCGCFCCPLEVEDLFGPLDV